jgi:hypothetical protein
MARFVAEPTPLESTSGIISGDERERRHQDRTQPVAARLPDRRVAFCGWLGSDNGPSTGLPLTWAGPC